MAKSSHPKPYTVLPSSSKVGIPAFGFAIKGILTAELIFSNMGIIWDGPVEQFIPKASAPKLSMVIAAVNTSVPYKALPSASKVIVTITGKSQVSFAAIKAALLS